MGCVGRSCEILWETKVGSAGFSNPRVSNRNRLFLREQPWFKSWDGVCVICRVSVKYSGLVLSPPLSMGLLTIIRKQKLKDREMRVLMLYV